MADPSDYDYHIETEGLNPPRGKMRYAARPALMVKCKGSEQYERVDPGLAEVWGETAEEAYGRAERAVKEWIDRQ